MDMEGRSCDSHGKSHLCRLMLMVLAVLFCLFEAIRVRTLVWTFFELGGDHDAAADRLTF